MAGRIAAGALVACGLLLPAALRAEPEAKSLEERVEALERAQKAADEAVRERERLERRVEELEREKAESEREADLEQERLERRVEELETTQTANEDTTRSLIAGALVGLGTRINEFVDFGGVIELEPGWTENFDGTDTQGIDLRTVELQFEIQVTDWARGSLVVEYDTGSDVVFTSVEDDEFSVDRINVDTAFATIGNVERFWPYLSIGRMVVPFGISTGDPVADVLSIADPLTVVVFETKRDALLAGFEFPTPTPMPEALIAAPEPVRPQVLAPVVGRLARLAGYRPLPPPPPVPVLTPVPPQRPPFRLGVYFYDGDAMEKASREGEWDLAHHMGAFAGYRTKGRCRPRLGGQPGAEELGWLHVFCPWTLDLGVEWNRSVFDSDFLSFEYRSFVAGDVLNPQGPRPPIGFVPGMAASAKTTFGPLSIVAEWNGALESAEFIDDDPISLIGRPQKRRPRAWQVSLGYQFDWKPWLEAIGSQGTYITAGYSASRDLGGAVRFNQNDFTSFTVGTVPKRQILVGVGEWVLPNLRLAIEWVRAWDYSKGHGGTNKVADGILSRVTFEW
jgi:hypothetical protein